MSRDIAAAGSGYQFLPARGSEMDTPTRIMRFICANASANGMGRSTMEVMASMPTSWTAAAPRYLGRHLAVGGLEVHRALGGDDQIDLGDLGVEIRRVDPGVEDGVEPRLQRGADPGSQTGTQSAGRPGPQTGPDVVDRASVALEDRCPVLQSVGQQFDVLVGGTLLLREDAGNALVAAQHVLGVARQRDFDLVARPHSNSLSDTGDLTGVTKAINGGLHGIQDRRKL